MANAEQRSTESLFHQWRKGDAAAGQAMAQRFTDWYFALAAVRLGESGGEPAFREACTHFSRGVGKVSDPRRLLGWAHGIARKQIHAATPGGRLGDGDLPNAFTRKHPPKEILVRVRERLPGEMGLLERSYRGEDVGDPISVMEARYRVKRFLRDEVGVPFRVAPEPADPDRAPLPLYEAGRLANETEDTHFELFMLHDMDVCQDVAEFAHFAIALRGGLPGEAPEAVAPAVRPASAAKAPAPVSAPPSVSAPAAAVSAPDTASAPVAPQGRVIPSKPGPPVRYDDEAPERPALPVWLMVGIIGVLVTLVAVLVGVSLVFG